MRPQLLAALLLTGCAAQSQTASRIPDDQIAQFTDSGRLVRPRGWDAWVMVGASTGLSYSEAQQGAAATGPGMFHNVYMQPWAYREVLQTGVFPEGTMFVLAFYEPSRKSTPARAGFYEGDEIPGIEVHIKKAGVDSSGWGFYGFGDTTRTAQRIPSAVACYSCHAKEAANDNVFTQFYPRLRIRFAQRAGTPRTGGGGLP